MAAATAAVVSVASNTAVLKRSVAEDQAMRPSTSVGTPWMKPKPGESCGEGLRVEEGWAKGVARILS